MLCFYSLHCSKNNVSSTFFKTCPGKFQESVVTFFAFESSNSDAVVERWQKVYSRTRSMTGIFYSWASIFSLFWLIHSVSFLTPLCSLLQLSKSSFHFIIKIHPFLLFIHISVDNLSLILLYLKLEYLIYLLFWHLSLSFQLWLHISYRIKFKLFSTFFNKGSHLTCLNC